MPILNLPFEPKVCLIRISDPESEYDSDDSNMMNELYHFDELDINDVELEWFDPNKAVNSDGWNEMTETEAKPETELEPKTEKDWADDADSTSIEFLLDPVGQMD